MSVDNNRILRFKNNVITVQHMHLSIFFSLKDRKSLADFQFEKIAQLFHVFFKRPVDTPII